MEFLEILKGESNRFDKGFPLNSYDNKALRDGIVAILDRIEALEARIPVEEVKTKKRSKAEVE